ncbi:uncharacterized protein [Henckelia pumila]|uniref:uncharacterized protein n=1 Tax=Henckelia pumila TaxID=405737 RepID=UPI003C6E64AF
MGVTAALNLTTLNCNGFKDVFYGKYFTVSTRTRLAKEFLEIRQGNMSIAEYVKKFERGRYFVPMIFGDPAEELKHFIEGLNAFIRKDVRLSGAKNYKDAVDQAMLSEKDRNDIIKESQAKRSSYQSRDQQGSSSRKRSYQAPPQHRPYQQQQPRPQGQKQLALPAPKLASAPTACQKCGKLHSGQCMVGTGVCFLCKKPGHYRKDCPQSKEPVRGRVFAMAHDQVDPNTTIVTGMINVSSNPAHVLIDSGATHSFISVEFVNKSGLVPDKSTSGFSISLPSGEELSSDLIIRGCSVQMQSHELLADHIILNMSDFDVIFEMDWLSRYEATIDCKRRTVFLKTKDGEPFLFHATPKHNSSLLISVGKAWQLLSKGCAGFLASVTCNQELPRPKLEDVEVVRDFPKLFPDDIAGLPPAREEKLMTTPVLAMPEGTGRFVIYTDASKSGLGVVLMQDGKIRIAQASDQQLLTWKLKDEAKGGALYTVKDGIVHQKGRMWVPAVDSLREYVMTEAHTVKVEYQRPAGLLKSLPIPTWKWEYVTMNFVIGLSITPRRMNSIWVIVDMLTKAAHSLPVRNNFSMNQYAELYIREVVRLHGVPARIVSDKDPRFTLNFWKSLHHGLGKKLAFSTAFHPQADGQSERVIQILEDLLRACMINFGGNWESKLPLVEFTYKNSYQATIGMAPYETLYGRKCRTPLHWDKVGERAVLGPKIVQQTIDMIAKVKDRILTAQSRQKSYADKRRRDLEFQVGDHVFLKVSPWKGVLRFGKKGKLSPRYIGSFEILDKVGTRAYRVALPPNLEGVHDVFHVSMLKKYISNPSHVIHHEPVHWTPDLSYEEVEFDSGLAGLG